MLTALRLPIRHGEKVETSTAKTGGGRLARLVTAAAMSSLVVGLVLLAPSVMGSMARTSANASSANGPATVSVEPSMEVSSSHNVEDAVALISYPWETKLPTWTISFLRARSNAQTVTLASQRLIDVYVRPEMSANDIAAVTAHQLGVAIDATLLTAADREAWRAVRGLTLSGPWSRSSTAEISDLTTGVGDFAEAFAAWQLGVRSLSQLAGQPDDAQFELLARLTRLAPTDPQPSIGH